MSAPAFVLDASVAIAGLSPDEPDSKGAALAERAIGELAAVPAIWPFEVANVLTIKRRRGVLSEESFERALISIADFLIAIEPFAPGSASFGGAVALARIHGLSVYDASYLEIARRRTLPLATIDITLTNAARAAGVAVMEKQGAARRPPPPIPPQDLAPSGSDQNSKRRPNVVCHTDSLIWRACSGFGLKAKVLYW